MTNTPSGADRASDPSALIPGFTVSVTVPVSPDAVFPYFTEPELFSQWFIVEGFDTPAEEIQIDPRPGGAGSGALIAGHGSVRIPFDFRYGRVDPPRLVQFTFSDPTEAVTIALHPEGSQHTRISYHKPYAGSEEAGGAQSMLEALARSIEATERSDHVSVTEERPARATSVMANLQVSSLEGARGFYAGYLGLADEDLGLDWVARFRTAGGQAVQLVTGDATAPEESVLSVAVGEDIAAAYEEAKRRGYEIVHPLTTEPWGLRRFLVRAPDGNVININSHPAD